MSQWETFALINLRQVNQPNRPIPSDSQVEVMSDEDVKKLSAMRQQQQQVQLQGASGSSGNLIQVRGLGGERGHEREGRPLRVTGVGGTMEGPQGADEAFRSSELIRVVVREGRALGAYRRSSRVGPAPPEPSFGCGGEGSPRAMVREPISAGVHCAAGGHALKERACLSVPQQAVRLLVAHETSSLLA